MIHRVILWTLLPFIMAQGLGATGPSKQAWDPFGLSEDEIDALRVLDPALREFAEFFTALLRHEDAPRTENFKVYQPIRRLAMKYRTVRGSSSFLSQTQIQHQVSDALWELSSPELSRIELNPKILLTPPSKMTIFTEGLENRALLLIRNNDTKSLALSLASGGDRLYFPPRTATLAPGQVRAFHLRIWGQGTSSLDLQLSINGDSVSLPLPLQWVGSTRLDLRIKNHDRSSFLPARVYVIGSDRLARGPSGTFLRSTWIGGHYYFHTHGASALTLPSGPAQIHVVHGFEHDTSSTSLELGPSSSFPEVNPKQRIDCASRGWYSGDIHIHLNLIHKTLDQFVLTQDARLQAEAEDLDVSNLLVCNSLGAITFDRDRFTGSLHPLSTTDRLFYWNEEVRASLYGHIAALNLKAFLKPNFTGFPHTDNAFDYPSNTIQAQQGQKQGAGIFYVHPVHNPNGNDLFGSSAKALPVDAALGAIDGMEILGYGHTAASLRLYYRLLNCGFRLAAAAGTDTFNNIRRHKVIGGDRVYVHTGDVFNYESWVQGLKKGRSFVTNGPLLFFRVNGHLPGSEQSLSEPGPVRVEVEAYSQVPMDRLDLIFNGKLIHTVKASGDSTHLAYQAFIPITGSGWLAARISGGGHRLVVNNPDLFAHTTPIYLTVAGKPWADADSVLHFLRWIQQLRLRLLTQGLFEQPIQKQQILEQFRQAETVYQEKLRSIIR